MSTGREEGIELAAFRLGGFDFAMESRFVASATPAAGTAGPLVDLADQGSPAGPVYDLSLILPAGVRRIVSVEGPMALFTIAPRDLRTLPPAVARHCAVRGLRAFALVSGNVVMIVDPRRSFL